MRRTPYLTVALVTLLAALLVPFRMTGVASAGSKASSVSRVGDQLYLNGKPYRFTGINAYHLANHSAVNSPIQYCGVESTAAQLDAFFASLRPNTMVRFWAFQHFAVNRYTGQIDFQAIDRVVNAAMAHGQRLIFTLGNEWPDCGDGPRKGEDWYASGYRQALPGLPLSYWDYIDRIVLRYASSPTVGMWEPMNEPETGVAASDGSGCSLTAATTLRQFFDAVGGKIKRLDPVHPVSSGVIGTAQCGAQNGEYETLHRSPGIDVGSYHDYGYDTSPLPGDQWNGFQVRVKQMAAVGKPIFVGESGIRAMGDGSPMCTSVYDRRSLFRAKMDAAFQAGAAGYLPWNWWPTSNSGCIYENITSEDPTFALIRNYRLPN